MKSQKTIKKYLFIPKQLSERVESFSNGFIHQRKFSQNEVMTFCIEKIMKQSNDDLAGQMLVWHEKIIQEKFHENNP